MEMEGGIGDERAGWPWPWRGDEETVAERFLRSSRERRLGCMGIIIIIVIY